LQKERQAKVITNPLIITDIIFLHFIPLVVLVHGLRQRKRLKTDVKWLDVWIVVPSKCLVEQRQWNVVHYSMCVVVKTEKDWQDGRPRVAMHR